MNCLVTNFRLKAIYLLSDAYSANKPFRSVYSKVKFHIVSTKYQNFSESGYYCMRDYLAGLEQRTDCEE